MKIKHLFLSLLAVAAVAVACKKEDPNDGKPSLTLNPTSLEFDVNGGTKTVAVEANREWSIADADKIPSWLKVEKTSDTEITVVATGKNEGKDQTYTVTVRMVGVKKTFTVTQKGEGGEVTPVEEGDGSKEKPYSATQAGTVAAALAADAFSETPVYVRGKIVSLKDDYVNSVEKYGTLSLYISNDGTKEKQFYVYAMRDVEGAKFTDAAAVAAKFAAGKDIVVYGYLQNFKGNTPEMTRKADGDPVNPQLISIDGDTPDVPVQDPKSATGVVVAVSAQGFLVQTESGLQYVFDSEIKPTVKLGDNVTVEGVKDEHSGIEQIVKYTVKTNSEGNAVTHPEPTEITAANIAEYNTNLGYIKTSGILVIKGDYYNLNIDGASLTGSLSYPVNVDASFKDKKVDVTGYFVGISGGKYFNILITAITLSADQPVVEEPGADSIILTFPDDNKENNKISAYTQNWVAKKGAVEFSIANFNNNKWEKNWAYIKCGRKEKESVASIATKSVIAKKIDKVVIFASTYAKENVNSAKLFVSAKDDFAGAEGVDMTYANGQLTAPVATPGENLYYKVVLDCKGGSGNGFVVVDKFVLWVNK
mgnify:CR=1 FL=1